MLIAANNKSERAGDNVILSWVVKLTGYFILAVSFIYLFYIGYRHWNDILFVLPIFSWKWAWLIGFLGLAYAIISIILPLAWRRVIILLGGRLSFIDSLSVFGRSQAAKYIPGNVFHFVGRQVFGIEIGLSNGVLVFSMIIETCLLGLAAAVIAFSTLGLMGMEYKKIYDQNTVIVFCVITAFLAIISITCYMFIKLKTGIKENDALRKVKFPQNVIGAAFILFMYALFFFGSGLLFWFLSQYLLSDASTAVFVMIGAYSLSWLVGFVTPGASGGIGVREAVLLATLASSLPEVQALALALSFRAVTVLGDGLFFLFSCCIRINAKYINKSIG